MIFLWTQIMPDHGFILQDHIMIEQVRIQNEKIRSMMIIINHEMISTKQLRLIKNAFPWEIGSKKFITVGTKSVNVINHLITGTKHWRLTYMHMITDRNEAKHYMKFRNIID